ncbi:MAG: hypothetical protein KAR35_02605 [Candidatus Heimdallarchaeota archaeon]|nr:hypothetical protein [Candidatus Heimdallarchaeota archaeon]MCK5048245.1 hypothetical protein [Candidatus Heimdallarchaeota archaeon]
MKPNFIGLISENHPEKGILVHIGYKADINQELELMGLGNGLKWVRNKSKRMKVGAFVDINTAIYVITLPLEENCQFRARSSQKDSRIDDWEDAETHQLEFEKKTRSVSVSKTLIPLREPPLLTIAELFVIWEQPDVEIPGELAEIYACDFYEKYEYVNGVRHTPEESDETEKEGKEPKIEQIMFAFDATIRAKDGVIIKDEFQRMPSEASIKPKQTIKILENAAISDYGAETHLLLYHALLYLKTPFNKYSLDLLSELTHGLRFLIRKEHKRSIWNIIRPVSALMHRTALLIVYQKEGELPLEFIEEQRGEILEEVKIELKKLRDNLYQSSRLTPNSQITNDFLAYDLELLREII